MTVWDHMYIVMFRVITPMHHIDHARIASRQ